jgi:hypothetical protein
MVLLYPAHTIPIAIPTQSNSAASNVLSGGEKGAEIDGIKWCHIYINILYKSRNEYENTRNKYKNRYFRKQI